jgi:epoxyqueuosine reductase
MTLGTFLRTRGIELFAFLDAEAPPVVKPRLLSSVPDARTVLFAAIPYYTAEREDSNLARFARCLDYHTFAEELGKSCSDFLKHTYPDCRAAGFADHSPFAEVRGAAMAGLGLLGDHGLLITERYSSFVFLFELLTTLTPNEMEKEDIPRGSGIIRECEHCGACTAACPGGCRNGDRSNCLSAITQKKGELSEREKALLRAAPFVWGCDRCQEVCPHTAAALAKGRAETEIPFFRRERIGTLTHEILETMTDEEYSRYAFGWRKKEVMRRNLRLRKEE